MDAALSGALATMCPAVPYALAAKFAHPDRPAIAATGDGAMQMLGNNALIDVARYSRRWSNQQLVVCVLNNSDLNQVTWEQRVLAGDPKLEASQVAAAFDYAAYARQLGLHGIRVDRPEDVGPAWDEALAAGRPALLEVDDRPRGPAAAAAHPLRAGRRRSPAPSRATSRGATSRESMKAKLAEFTTR